MRSGILLATFALGAATAVQGQRSLSMDSFHADIVVTPDGVVDVTERLMLDFRGSWNGIVRAIPVEYATGYGANYTLLLDLVSVQDDGGSALRTESERSGRNRRFRIWVPGAENARRTVVLRYRVKNGLRFFDEHDELYWNVTGDETEFPIARATARVILPDGVSGVRTTAFTGTYGSTEQNITTREQGPVIEFATTRPLGFREGLTVVVGWDPGVVARPTAAERAGRFLLSNIILLVPLGAFFGMLGVWRRHGRDPETGPIAVQYEPPDGLTPAEAGTIIDTRPDMRDVTATIVDLAVRSYLVIEETEKQQLFGLLSSREFVFESKRDPAEWQSLKRHEVKLLDALFDGGSRSRVATSQLENEFYKDLPGIRKALSGILVKGGHYLRDPKRVLVMWIAIAIGAGALVGFLGTAALAALLGQPTPAAVAAGFLTALVIGGFGLFMPARTVRGTRVLADLRGFEEFLRRVESDRFERIEYTPEMFEKYLPYAMAFGVEQQWARAFDDIYRTPPEWYRGPHGGMFHAHGFTSSLGRMASATGSAMTTAPRSSSSGSSGFGGGGFSGGGFGGGGTSGF